MNEKSWAIIDMQSISLRSSDETESERVKSAKLSRLALQITTGGLTQLSLGNTLKNLPKMSLQWLFLGTSN